MSVALKSQTTTTTTKKKKRPFERQENRYRERESHSLKATQPGNDEAKIFNPGSLTPGLRLRCLKQNEAFPGLEVELTGMLELLVLNPRALRPWLRWRAIYTLL